jgi:hypothetical protein
MHTAEVEGNITGVTSLINEILDPDTSIQEHGV